MLRAIALTSKETTPDYEWAYQQYMGAVAVPPVVVMTDADPGATAAVAKVFPRSRHFWCLWHIHQNLRKNLGSTLGGQYTHFATDFKIVQQQVSKTVFERQYATLKQLWPEAVPYLDEQLTPNVRFWAGYRFDVFTTGAISTQRGEGLNLHMKHHLSLQIPLVKLFKEVLIREKKEEARATVRDARDQVCLTSKNNVPFKRFLPTPSDMVDHLADTTQFVQCCVNRCMRQMLLHSAKAACPRSTRRSSNN